MRIPKKIKKGDLIEVRATIRYPSTTGLKLVDEEKNIFKRAKPAIFLELMEVFYGKDKITEFQMTSATSPDPLIRFKVVADKEAPIRIVFHTNGGDKAEISRKVEFTR